MPSFRHLTSFYSVIHPLHLTLVNLNFSLCVCVCVRARTFVKLQQTFQARPRQPVKVVIRMCCDTHPHIQTHIHTQPHLAAGAEMLWPAAACKVWCSSPLVSLNVRVWTICLVHCRDIHSCTHAHMHRHTDTTSALLILTLYHYCPRRGVKLQADNTSTPCLVVHTLTLIWDVQHAVHGILRLYTSDTLSFSSVSTHLHTHLLSNIFLLSHILHFHSVLFPSLLFSFPHWSRAFTHTLLNTHSFCLRLTHAHNSLSSLCHTHTIKQR